LSNQSYTQKTGVIPLFFGDFNNSHIILTRTVSRFGISIQNRNLTTAARSALISKVRYQKWLLFGQFLTDFNDLHIILTRIALQIRIFFRNQNPITVARAAMIIVSIIKFPCQTKQGG
jgi:hypothetical protein